MHVFAGGPSRRKSRCSPFPTGSEPLRICRVVVLKDGDHSRGDDPHRQVMRPFYKQHIINNRWTILTRRSRRKSRCSPFLTGFLPSPGTPYTPSSTPFTQHSTPYTLRPTPYALHPAPYALHPTPYTLHPTPYTLHPAPYTLHPTPYALRPTPYALGLSAKPGYPRSTPNPQVTAAALR